MPALSSRWFLLTNKGVLELLRLEKTSVSIHDPITIMFTINPCPQVPHLHKFWTLYRPWFHHFPGEPVPMLTSLPMKNFFLIFNLNLFGHNLSPFPLLLSLVTWKKRLIPTLLQPIFRELKRANGIYHVKTLKLLTLYMRTKQVILRQESLFIDWVL